MNSLNRRRFLQIAGVVAAGAAIPITIAKAVERKAVAFFALDISGSFTWTSREAAFGSINQIKSLLAQKHGSIEFRYIWHDSLATEVDENKFYKGSIGGGTISSTAFQYAAEQLPDHPLCYFYYFSDGDNWGADNALVAEIIKTKMSHFQKVGVCTVDGQCSHYVNSLSDHLLKHCQVKSLVTWGVSSGRVLTGV